MTRKLFKALKKQKDATEQVALQIYGTLGIPLGGQKLVEVPNRNAFVFVKLRDNQNEVIQAYNNQVATSYGLPVKVQRQGNRYIVLGVDTERYQNMWNSNSPFLPKHGGSHSFNLGGGGAGDVTWVYSQQMMPLLVYPTSTTGAWNANIAPHTLLDTAGHWRSVGNTGTISFQPYIPTGSSAVMGLIYLDATSGNPGVLIASGSYFPNTITGSLDIYAYIPTPNIATQIPLTAVRLDTGTYNIGWENLYDVRQWVSAVPTGTSSSSVSSGTAINIWDEGVLKGVADTLNVVGGNADISVSGTVARLFVTGTVFSGVDQIGIFGFSGTTPLGTGTSISFGSYLLSSITGTTLYLAGSVGTGTSQLATGDRGVTNGDLHNHTGSGGGTIPYTALSNRPAAETNANSIFRCDSPGGTSAWTGTINGAPSGASVTLTTSTGTKASLKPSATTHLAKMRLYNLTRGNSALISDFNTGTNVCTLTATAPASWANGDSMTIASQTVTGAPISYVDLEITSGPTGRTYMFISMLIISATVGDNMRLHPLEAFGTGKQKTAQAIVANQNGVNLALLKITSNVFSFGWTGTPTNVILSEEGYLE